MRGIALVLVAGLGCYAPKPQPGAPCANGECPAGLVCSAATDTCELVDADAAIDGAMILDDALVDAARIDAAIDAAPAVPMLVQQAVNHTLNATSISATFPAAPASGRVVVMIGAAISGSITTVSGGGATWTRATNSLINSNVEVWYGVSDGTSATVTIARPSESSQMWLSISEWTSLATANMLDGARSVDGTDSPVSAGSITTQNARDLLLFAATSTVTATYGNPSPGTWTAMQGIVSTGTGQQSWYRVVESTGAYAPSVTATITNWESAVVALKIAP